MLIESKPIKVEVEERVCGFHKNAPHMPYAGCTCSTSYIAKEKTLEEILEDESEVQVPKVRLPLFTRPDER